MCTGGSSPSVDYAAQQRAADAETARLNAAKDLETQKADQQIMADKLSQAAKEAGDFNTRQTLLAKAGLGNTEDDPLNPSTRKKPSGSLLSALQTS